MEDELARCQALGLPGLVAHPGSHGGAGEKAGLAMIADSLNSIFEKAPASPVEVWLENTAGQGTALGWRFEHLAEIVGRVDDQSRVGVCLDTCHAFAAGYDLRGADGWASMWREFDATVGRGRLRALHVNDSKKPLGSRVDRHEGLGEGEIGPEAFRLLMADESLAGIPKVLETPKGDAGELDWDNLGRLARWLAEGKAASA
jgi:deoxyribonuclease-4